MMKLYLMRHQIIDLVLKREFVNRIGYWTIQNAIKYDESGEMKETIDWLLNDENALQLLQKLEIQEIRINA